MRHTLSAILFLLTIAACGPAARVAAPAAQDLLDVVRVEVDADGGAVVRFSTRAIYLGGGGAASARVLAPVSLRGEPSVVFERSVAAGESRAWEILLYQDDGDWLEVREVPCERALELLGFDLDCETAKSSGASMARESKPTRVYLSD